MPIEIKELVIRATVDQEGQRKNCSPISTTNENKIKDSDSKLNELLRMIKEKNER